MGYLLLAILMRGRSIDKRQDDSWGNNINTSARGLFDLFLYHRTQDNQNWNHLQHQQCSTFGPTTGEYYIVSNRKFMVNK